MTTDTPAVGSQTCPAERLARATVRRCDLPAGHDGYHVSDDGYGRPEYYWPASSALRTP